MESPVNSRHNNAWRASSGIAARRWALAVGTLRAARGGFPLLRSLAALGVLGLTILAGSKLLNIGFDLAGPEAVTIRGTFQLTP